MFSQLVEFIRAQYQTTEFIPLHAPVFSGREEEYVVDTIRSTFVSSVGAYVDRFENGMAQYTGAEKATAVVNGTAALHTALILAGVQQNDLVLTQSLTFVATCNAIRYCGAEPVFLDVDLDTMGLSPAATEQWLADNAQLDSLGTCRLKGSDQAIRACLPMHTFGHPVKLDELLGVCKRWNIHLIEDAAESLGSFYKGKHTGTFGMAGTLSFNGNKVMTTGGGGMILCNAELGAKAKHLTTTAKRPHPYEFFHDEVAFNYRMPNLNAALGCAQLEMLNTFVQAKRKLAQQYENFLQHSELKFFKEPEGCKSNYWLNAVICEDGAQRDALLKTTNECGVMTRPIWTLMNRLPMYRACLTDGLENAKWLEARVVNLPSSVILNESN